MIRSVLVAGLALALICLSHPAALAQGGGIGIIPKQPEDGEARSWFIYTLNAGESVSDTVTINNHSDQKKFIQIEALDGLTTLSGNYSLVENADANQDLGTWVKLDASRIYVAPHSSQEVDFIVTVPEHASVGEHAGGVVIYEINPLTSGVNIKARVGARMYVMVPGKVARNITFEDVSYSIKDNKLIFYIKAKNDSNVKLEPALDIILSGLFGRITQTEQDAGTYLAGRSIELTREWDRGAPHFGYYRVQFVFNTLSVEQVLADGTKTTLPSETFTHTISIWVGTVYLWWMLGILVLAWLIYRMSTYINDLRKYRTRIEVYTVGAHENLNKISEKTGIMVSVIIKFNHLKWPHRTKKGEQLLIPRGRLASHEVREKQLVERLPDFTKYLLSFRHTHYHPRFLNLTKPKTTPKHK